MNCHASTATYRAGSPLLTVSMPCPVCCTVVCRSMRGEACSKQQGGRRQQILNCAQLTANQQPVYVVLISCMQLISYPQSSCMWHVQQTALGTGCLAAAFRQLVCWLGESLPAHLRIVCPVGLALCAWTSSTRHGAPCLVSSSTCSACISSALAAA